VQRAAGRFDLDGGEEGVLLQIVDNDARDLAAANADTGEQQVVR